MYISYSEDSTIMKHNNTSLIISNDGTLEINGTIKDAAYALFKVILQLSQDSTSISYNNCILVKSKEFITIEWIGRGIINSNLVKPKPKFWDEFKLQFEELNSLKAFI